MSGNVPGRRSGEVGSRVLGRLGCLLVAAACLGLIEIGWTGRVDAGPGEQPTGTGKPDGKGGAEAAKVARLIGQLDSASFAEREAASRALEAIGLPALGALRETAARGGNLEVRRRAERLVRAIENRLDGLAVVYRDYGLPLPNRGVPLVRVRDGGEGPPAYWLAFLLRLETRERPPIFLQGMQRYEYFRGSKYQTIDPGRAAREIQRYYVGVDPEQALALAVQCKVRGWDALAQAVFDRGFRPEATRRPREMLPGMAWDYWENELVRVETDLATIARRLCHLIAAEKELNTREHRELLADLEAALVPGKAKPGSVQARIDDLIHARHPFDHREEEDPRCLRLLEMGFTAVPELIEHLDDRRLMRYVEPGSAAGLGPSRHCRVRDLVEIQLARLAGGELHPARQGGRISKESARAWWARARKTGEEAYLLRHVLSYPGREGPAVDEDLLRILTHKYPRRLPEVYRTLVDQHPRMRSQAVAEAVTRSTLPREKKVELFLHAIKGKPLEHRWAGLIGLRPLEPRRFVELLIEALDSLPATRQEAFGLCPAAPFAWLVPRAADPRAWQALTRAARRADSGLRLEILRAIRDAEDDPPRKEVLDFLAGFLEDATVRDTRSNREKFEGPSAASEFPRLEVRNFAAMQLASCLKLSAEPKPGWSAEQWARLRKQVRQRLQTKRPGVEERKGKDAPGRGNKPADRV